VEGAFQVFANPVSTAEPRLDALLVGVTRGPGAAHGRHLPIHFRVEVLRLRLQGGERMIWILGLSAVITVNVHLVTREQFLFVVAAALPRILLHFVHLFVQTLLLTRLADSLNCRPVQL